MTNELCRICGTESAFEGGAIKTLPDVTLWTDE